MFIFLQLYLFRTRQILHSESLESSLSRGVGLNARRPGKCIFLLITYFFTCLRYVFSNDLFLNTQ